MVAPSEGFSPVQGNQGESWVNGYREESVNTRPKGATRQEYTFVEQLDCLGGKATAFDFR